VTSISIRAPTASRATPTVARVLQVSGLDEVFPTYPTVQAAQDAHRPE